MSVCVIETLDDAIEACAQCGIPDHMVGGVFSYIVHGIEPGGFMTAVICNDLMAAAGRADHMNITSLGGWAKLLYNHFPSRSHGSPAAMKEWMDKRAAERRGAA